MRIRQLRYFEAVAEELHFGRAAEKLYIQQPPLSRQIKTLEEELGTELFKRTNRKVELTDAGRYFLEEAKQILTTMDRAKTTLQAMGDGTAGKLHVGFVYLALSSAFPDIVGSFMKKYPLIDVVLHDESTMEQLAALHEGTFHVGFITLNIAKDLDLPYVIVQKTHPCAAIPASHPLAEKEMLTLQDLSEIPYICSRESHCRIRLKEIQKQFHEKGLKLKLGMQYHRKHTGTVFVAAGQGWTFVNCDSKHISPEGIALRPVDTDYDPFEIAMAWHPERITPLVENFINFYKNKLKEQTS